MDYAIKVKDLSKAYSIYDSPALRLKDALGLSKQYNGRNFFALENINFCVEKGKTLAIIGENGAGKSTLLKILTGVLTPTSGSFELNGKVSALLELGTGFNPEYTGIENIYLSGNIMGLTKEQIQRKVSTILEFADIGDFAYQKVKTYSSGMFARLAFAVAINVEPEILIVDEALSVGDLFFQQKCNRFMKEKMANCTKLLVTHDMGSVANMADEAIVISKGKQVFVGEPLQAIEFYTKKAHTELFMQSAHKESSESLQSAQLKLDDETWISVNKDALGGALEVSIVAYRIWIDQEEYKGYVTAKNKVRIEFILECEKDMDEIIIGYQIKDKYGNTIFGENTHSSGFSENSMRKGQKYLAELSFTWPQIQENSYFLTLGVGEGNDAMQHIIQCWAHSIFEFKAISHLPDHGLFNNKIDDFVIKTIE